MRRLIQRLIAAWKLRKVKFEFCRECGVPMTADEHGWWCIDCTEARIVNPPLNPVGMEEAYKEYNKQQYLAQQAMKQQNQLQAMLNQQNPPTLEQQQHMAAAQQNIQGHFGALGSQLGNALGGLFGRGPMS